jgi:hypothetical protein
LTNAVFTSVGSSSGAAYDIAASSISGGTLVYSFSLAKSGSSGEDLSDLSLFLQAGESFTITAQSTSASDVSVTLSWGEDA